MTCTVFYGLFITAVTLVIAGHGAGVIAWRRRRPEYTQWQWLYDPTYVFRSRYYLDPKPRLRIVAAVLLTAAGVLILVLASYMISVQSAGADGICGLSF
jgi:hypothetical protein